jgi:hypothetical protein
MRHNNADYNASLMSQIVNFNTQAIPDNGSEINDNLSDVVGSKGGYGAA